MHAFIIIKNKDDENLDLTIRLIIVITFLLCKGFSQSQKYHSNESSEIYKNKFLFSNNFFKYSLVTKLSNLKIGLDGNNDNDIHKYRSV